MKLSSLVLLSLFAFFISPCLAQKTERNLYAEALEACVHKEAKDYSKINVEHDLKNRVVEYDFDITTYLPKQFGEIKVEYLSPGDIIERYKKNRKGKSNRPEVNVLSIDVMRSDGTNLRISIAERWISYEGKRRHWFSPKEYSYARALEGGCHVDFSYDPEKKAFFISNTKLWGV